MLLSGWLASYSGSGWRCVPASMTTISFSRCVFGTRILSFQVFFLCYQSIEYVCFKYLLSFLSFFLFFFFFLYQLSVHTTVKYNDLTCGFTFLWFHPLLTKIKTTKGEKKNCNTSHVLQLSCTSSCSPPPYQAKLSRAQKHFQNIQKNIFKLPSPLPLPLPHTCSSAVYWDRHFSLCRALSVSCFAWGEGMGPCRS